MQVFRSARWLLLALLLSVVPASSFAGVFISVGFAPPMLPVYDQPPCPEDGLMWTPGYWAYGPDGYYWVPGAWVPAPYEGALWTPGYWGWSGGMFVFHEGYWGRHVGYYGGVNYGFGYGGIGFAGGEWRGGRFAYNTAVMRVDTRFVHVTFMDRGRVDRGFVDRGSRIAFSGGPGGIRHQPMPQERFAEHEQHMDRTTFQTEHVNAAMHDRAAYFNNNHGRPSTLAGRPMGADANHGGSFNRNKTGQDSWQSPTRTPNAGPGTSGRDNYNGSRPNTGNAMGQGGRGNSAQPGMAVKSQGIPDRTPQARPNAAPQARPYVAPAPQARPNAAPQGRPNAAPQGHPGPGAHPEGGSRPEHPHGRSGRATQAGGPTARRGPCCVWGLDWDLCY